MIDPRSIGSDFEQRFGRRALVVSAPGRVNLIGEHTDYNEGFVLPFAIDKRTYVACAARDDGIINAFSQTLYDGLTIDLSDNTRGSGWGLYIKGIADRLASRGIAVSGGDILIDSDIPVGAGLSSSAALEVSVGFALLNLAGSKVDLVDLALAGQEVEHQYAGVRSGIMDQYTSALAAEDNALLIDCRSLSFENVPISIPGYALLVCDSRVEHELASSEYNQRRLECEEGVLRLKEYNSSITSLRDVSMNELEIRQNILSDTVFRRCRHVISENRRTIESAEALRKGELTRLGSLMLESHKSLRDDYEVSCPELDLLVSSATEHKGVLGARMTGGGFGGSTINLVEERGVEGFTESVKRSFSDAFGHDPGIFRVSPSRGVMAHI